MGCVQSTDTGAGHDMSSRPPPRNRHTSSSRTGFGTWNTGLTYPVTDGAGAAHASAGHHGHHVFHAHHHHHTWGGGGGDGGM